MFTSNKTTTSSPDEPSGDPPETPFDKEPPSTQPVAKETPSGKPENLQLPKQLPSNSQSDKRLHLPSPLALSMHVAFLNYFTRKIILALVKNSAKSKLLKIHQDCYHSTGATISSTYRNFGILYIAKQLGMIMLNFYEYKVLMKDLQASNRRSRFTKELKKAKAKEIAAHNVKFGKLTKPRKKSGQRPQDFITFNPKNILKQTCPQCGHFNTTELQSAKEIKQINKQLEHEHLVIKMCQWENKSTAVKLKTRKPRKKPTQERQIACYCHDVHCIIETSRGVCYHGRGYLKDGNDLPMDQTGTACKCEICLCKCDLIFAELKQLAIASAIDPLKEPDEEKAAVGGASVFLSYVEGKIDTDHLQNTHSTAFLDIISNPVLGSARVKKTLQEAMGPLQTTFKDGKTINQLRDEKRGVKSKPSSDSRFHSNKLSLAPMNPSCFLCNRILKKFPIKKPMDTPPLKIGSYQEPITLDGDTEDSKPRPRTLIHTSSRNQEPPKDETPAFVWSDHQLVFKKADFQMSSQDTQDILDFVGPKLTYKDDSEVAVNMKVCVLDHGESGKEATKSLFSVVKWCKQVQVHKQQKVQKEDD
eukprot:jgi/Psemu1/13479/gm1.13479_g